MIIASAESTDAAAGHLLQLGPVGIVVVLAVGACLLLKSRRGRAATGKRLQRAGRAAVRFVRVALWSARLRMPIRLGYRLQPDRWREMCTHRRLSGLKRGRVTRTAAGVAVRVRLGGGIDLAALQSGVDRLEAGLAVKRRSVRVEAGDRADRAVVHIVLRDPLKDPVLWTPGATTVTVPAEVATTPHGERMTVDLLRRWLVPGTTGSGKSVFLRTMAAPVAMSTDGRLTYCDPKRVEGAQWRHLAAVACSPEEIGAAISAFRVRMDERLQDMAKRGVTTHEPTEQAPAEVLLIDEAADVVRSITDEQLEDLHAIAEQGRAPRFVLWIGIQDPRGDNIPRGIVTQMQGVACLKLRDSTEAAVVFGRSARKDGWTPERLPGGGGWVLLRSDDHPDPEPARGDWLSEDALSALRRPGRPTPPARPTLQKAVSAPVAAVPAPVGPERRTDARTAVLDALSAAGEAGTDVASLQEATGLGKSRVYEVVKALLADGDAVKVRHGVFGAAQSGGEVAA
jgi:hypothetical protein